MSKAISQKECYRVYDYKKTDLEKNVLIFEKWEQQIIQKIEKEELINLIYNLFSQGFEETRDKCVPSQVKPQVRLWYTILVGGTYALRLSTKQKSIK